jgi:capsule polysaccharide export protein KpsE/RkpR
MNEDQIRAELKAVKAAVREDNPDVADLQTRVHAASSSLVVLIGQRQQRMPPLREHNVRKLIALWTEVKTALEARTPCLKRG